MVTEPIVNPEIKEIKNTGTEGIFEIEPLSPGYGITVGNTLRRVLFSSLGGAAIYAIKIEGVTHEFSAIKGIKEDIISLILNIKSFNVTLEGDDKATLKLKVKGPKDVKASDIETPAGCEIKNPESKIATLGKNTKLNIEFFVDTGMGYVASEKKKEQTKGEIGLIFIDATYTPIEKVNFRVENIRVGQATNYDKLHLDISTDGTLDPAKALKKSAQILCSQFEAVSSIVVDKKKVEKKVGKKVKKKIKKIAKIVKPTEKTKVEKIVKSKKSKK